MKTLGKYNIGRTLGSGASSKVKLATDSETGQKVAIKIFNEGMYYKLYDLVNVELKAL